jgi:hypothetical protein
MTGFPHCVAEDDIHDGYYIPKGSLVMPNIWLVLPSFRIQLVDRMVLFATGSCLTIHRHMLSPHNSTLNAS